MYLHSLACAVPPYRFRQSDLWPIYESLPLRHGLRPGSNRLVEKLLVRENGVSFRHFVSSDFGTLFTLDAEGLNRMFETNSPALAADALEQALEGLDLDGAQLDGLVVCTCTGYLCPGLSSHIAERLGVRSDAVLIDVVGMGCGAAIPSLRTAQGLLASMPEGARVAVVAVEVCSAAFFLEDKGDVIVSACLFGDGAAAAVLSNRSSHAEGGWRFGDFDTEHRPADRETLRFLNDGGKLKNRLARTVPAKAADAVGALWERASERDPSAATIIPHSGGVQVLDALTERFGGLRFSESEWTLRNGGNMSSPSVLFSLAAYLQSHDVAIPLRLPSAWEAPPSSAAPSADRLWLTSFGAGFSAHACSLVREE